MASPNRKAFSCHFTTSGTTMAAADRESRIKYVSDYAFDQIETYMKSVGKEDELGDKKYGVLLGGMEIKARYYGFSIVLADWEDEDVKAVRQAFKREYAGLGMEWMEV